MPVSIKVARINPSRLAKLRRAFGDVAAPNFLRSIATKDLAFEVVEFMAEQTGINNLNSYGLPNKDSFGAGWLVRRKTEGSQVFFQITHRLLSHGSLKGSAKFNSIEYGSAHKELIARRTFHFKGSRGWITIAEGRRWNHASNPARNTGAKAKVFIEQVILPRLGERITEKIRRKFD